MVEIADKTLPLRERITERQVEQVIETVKDACIEAVKEEPDNLPNSDEIQRGFARGINYAIKQIKAV